MTTNQVTLWFWCVSVGPQVVSLRLPFGCWLGLDYGRRRLSFYLHRTVHPPARSFMRFVTVVWQ